MPPLTRILPALVHIQAHLDQDLSLDALAGHVGLSKYHFHELFQCATGETPKAYVERLRLEWAAVQLRIRRVAVRASFAGQFARLTAWALRRGGGTPLLLGIARDAPGVTPAAKIRFDCCVQVPATFDADGEIGCQRTPGGDHAITEYVGSWDLGPAYASILERLHKMPKIDIIGLPAIEFYRTTEVGARDGLARVAIAIPIATRRIPARRPLS